MNLNSLPHVKRFTTQGWSSRARWDKEQGRNPRVMVNMFYSVAKHIEKQIHGSEFSLMLDRVVDSVYDEI